MVGSNDSAPSDLSQSTEAPNAVMSTTVLVIGGGVTGLLSSILLAKHGIDSVVVERYEKRLGQPKAHAVNPRSLEILRQAGLDTVAFRRRGMSPHDGDMVRFATSLSGIEFGSLPYERQENDAHEVTPEPLFNISQPILEQFLTERVANQTLITLRKPAQYITTYQCNSKERPTSLWMSLILDKKTNLEFEIQSKYILICDGANSMSRSKFGIPFSPLPGHPVEKLHSVSVHFDADLRQFKSGTLWFFMRHNQRGTLICYDRSNSWVYVVRRRADNEPKSIFTERYCRSLIDDAIGQQVLYNVLSITHWTTMPQAADFYRSKLVPEAFLLGDAAHAFPPTGGLGLNTGIADAHNLMWKIHAVEASWSSSTILDTYSQERRPVAIVNAHRSQVNMRNLQELLARTFNPEATDEQLMHDLRARECLNNAIDKNRDHFDSINLQIGYVYGEEGPETPQCRHYTPRCVRGARLPHMWIERNGVKCSSLDLIDGTCFVLLASQSFPRSDLTSVEVRRSMSVPLKTFRYGQDFFADDVEWAAKTSFSQTDMKAILIRPDQHIVGVAELEDEIPFMLSEFLDS